MASNNCKPQQNLYNKINVFYIFLSISAIAGVSLNTFVNPAWIWLHYLTKPTATVLLVCWVLLIRVPIAKCYRNAIALGLVFAAVGDFFLMLPKDYFLAGLLCFLLTHCAYIYALSCDGIVVSDIKNHDFSLKFTLIRPILIIFIVFILFTAIALLIFSGLRTHLPDSIKLPVAIYAAILAFMAALAMVRAISYQVKHYQVKNYRVKRAKSPVQQAASCSVNYAALGGLFFVVSDSLLAYGRFYFTTPFSPLWVLGTYYIAQWCFARSVLRNDVKV